MLVIFAILSLVLSGCSQPDDSIDTDVPPIGDFDAGERDSLDDFTMEAVTMDNILEFVTLSQHRGIEYDPVQADIVTDQDIDAVVIEHLTFGTNLVEVTVRSAMLGDVVIIDFEGFVDGVPFEGGTAENSMLQIGSGQFIPGFEEQIIGHDINDVFEINVTFPDDYFMPELAGQDASFTINLKAIYIEVPQELTDEFVTTYLGIESVEQYREIIRERLEQEMELQAKNEMRRQVWLAVSESATIHSYPLQELEFAADRILLQFREAAMTHNSELEDFIEQAFGVPYQDFLNNYIRPDAFIDVRQDLVLRAVAATEGITVTEEELNTEIRRFTDEFDFESEMEFLQYIGGEGRVWMALLSEKVIDVLMYHAVERG
ncbi:MAG: trigger factor [Defluviitaleaceae bacterium]|nr:trigger factor [Defluviitaleaceae bacterium]